MVDKLNQCYVTAGSLYLHENIVSCLSKNASDSLQMKVKYTVNKAPMLIFKYASQSRCITRNVSKPSKIDIACPELIISNHLDIVNKAISLSEALCNIRSHHKQY